MADKRPQNRAKPKPAPAPSVYGGQWGAGGSQGDADSHPPDRPSPIKTPKESTGWPDPENSAPTGD